MSKIGKILPGAVTGASLSWIGGFITSLVCPILSPIVAGTVLYGCIKALKRRYSENNNTWNSNDAYLDVDSLIGSNAKGFQDETSDSASGPSESEILEMLKNQLGKDINDEDTVL